MHKNLALLEDTDFYKSLIEASMDAVVIINDQMQVVLINPAAQEMFGYEASEVLGEPIEMLIPDRFRASHADHVKRFGQGKATTRKMGALGAVSGVRRNGDEFPAEASISKIVVQDHTFYAAILRDITLRVQSELKIRGLTRLYAVQSGVNNAILRIRDIKMLFKEACRIVAEEGKFPVVWIGFYDKSSNELTPSAWLGINDNGLPIRLMRESHTTQQLNILDRLLDTKQPVVLNDLDVGPATGSSEYDAAKQLGLHSLMAMPLLVDGVLQGVIEVFANAENFFDTEEIALLNEVAGDISFALLYTEKQERINYLAYYDSLTGLANRDVFLDRLAQYIDNRGGSKLKVAVLVMDIDRFKSINDTYGRHAGDELLMQIAARFERGIEDKQFRHARLSGDVFAIAIPDMRDANEIVLRIEAKLKRYFGTPYQIGNSELMVSARIGVAMCPDDGDTAEVLFRNAEAALRKAKTSGDRYLFYTEHMNDRVAELLNMENKLRRAIERKEFVLYYQPKVALDTRNIVGVEALIRWKDPENGLVPPIDFIPLLEETGLILEVGEWILRRAVEDTVLWQKAGLDIPRVAVNVSEIQLRQQDFVDIVKDAIASGIKPTNIDIEITESMIMDDMESNVAKLRAIRDMGIAISIDDFGTGYSSLAYLAKLPVKTLKIDRSFILSMLDDSNSMSLVSTIISLAHSLQLEVIAEGVENEEQAKILHLLRCNQMQGYLYSKPVPFEEMSRMLSK